MKSTNNHHSARSIFARSILPLIAVLFLLCISTAMAADNGYEQPGEFRASDILTPELLKGAYHKVDEQVRHDGFFYLYSVQSPFGAYLVTSTNALKTLVHGLGAILAMQEVKTEETVLFSANNTGYQHDSWL